MLTLGISNGSLYDPTMELLERVGINIVLRGREFSSDIKGLDAFGKVMIMRPQDIPEAIWDGTIDVGICGWDCVVESGLCDKLKKVTELNYSKKTSAPVKVVIFGKRNEISDKKEILVTSEYPNITSSFFKNATIRFSYGSTEVKVKEGKYDYGVGVIETGQSLLDNGLKVLKNLLVSSTILVARENIPEIKLLGELLSGAEKAKEYVLVKMNVDKKNKDKVIDILPSLKSPTVEKRADGLFAIETVIRKDEIANTVIAIRRVGATDILVQDINTIL